MQSRCFVGARPLPTCLRGLLALFIVGLLIGLNGCSSPPPEEVVEHRALERWQALIQGDFKKAYSYLSPSYRAVTSFALYRAHFGGAVRWQDVALKEISCADKVCNVVLTIHYQYTGRPVGKYKGKRPLKETWVKADNVWWLLPEE